MLGPLGLGVVLAAGADSFSLAGRLAIAVALTASAIPLWLQRERVFRQTIR